MRDIKTRQIDSRGLLLICNIIMLISILIVNIFGVTIWQFLSVYVVAFVLNFILIIDWIHKRRAAQKNLTETDKKRLERIKNLIDAKNHLNARLFEYLIISEGRFEFVKASADHIGNDPITETLAAVDKIYKISKKPENAEDVKNAEIAFTHDNFHRLKSGIEQMNEAIVSFADEVSGSEVFGNDEIGLIKKAAESWNIKEGDTALVICEMLVEYLRLISSAVEGIQELREY